MISLWQHQKDAIKKAQDLDYFALFFEQGTGKTATLINILEDKFGSEKIPLRSLILCPPIVIENWKREFLSYGHVAPDRLVTLTGSKGQRLALANEARHNSILITNYQSLLMDDIYFFLLEETLHAIVLDESHKIKSMVAKTTKRALALSKKATYRYCLSGTPILNSAFDIFPQVQFLDQGKTFGGNFHQFREKYFVDFNRGMPRHKYFPNWQVKPTGLAEINQAIKPFSARVLKKECLDLPPLIRQRVDCYMTSEQREVYEKLEKDFVADLSSGQVIADLEITKGLRLQQIVTGYCPNDEGVINEFQPNERLAAVRELLEQLSISHKIIIWAVFRKNFEDLELLCTNLKLPFVSVYGGVSSSIQRQRCDRFETDNSIRVLIGHPRSCGVGVNLTAADYSVWYSRGFSLEDELQAEARNYRGGSEKHEAVVRIDLVTPGTIDEVVLKALSEKQSLSDAILKHLNIRKSHAISDRT